MREKKENICKGCKVRLESKRTFCRIGLRSRIIIIGTNKEYQCPCGTCLLKMICSKQCQELTNYFHLVHNNSEVIE